MRRFILLLVVLALLLLPLASFAQSFVLPPAPGTPTWPLWHPWNHYHPQNPANLARYGLPIGYIHVPSRAVTIYGYDSLAGMYRPYTVIIPGFTITETTTGYVYPSRWELREVSRGVYQWVLMPAFFQPKY